MPPVLAPEKQLAIARMLIDGASYMAIRDELGVGAASVKKIRRLVFDGLVARDIELRCGCGNDLGHRGHCKADRAPSSSNRDMTDADLAELLDVGLAEPQRRRQPKDPQEAYAQQLGRYHGMGESIPSIRQRLNLKQLELERLQREYPRAWALGVKQGEQQLAAAKERSRLATERDIEAQRAAVIAKESLGKSRKRKRKPAAARKHPDPPAPIADNPVARRSYQSARPIAAAAPATSLPAPSIEVEKQDRAAGDLTAIPWDIVIADLESRRAALHDQVARIDQAIDSCRMLQEQYP